MSIVHATLLTFTMHPIDDIGSHMGYCITLFLAAVFFQFVICEDLPKVPYATVLDLHILIVFVLIVLIMFLTGAVGYYDREDWDISMQNACVGAVILIHACYSVFIALRVVPRERAKRTRSTKELRDNEGLYQDVRFLSTTKPGVEGLLVVSQLDPDITVDSNDNPTFGMCD